MHKFKRSHNFFYRNRQKKKEKQKIRRNLRKKKKNNIIRRTRKKEEEKNPISYRSMNACCYFCCNFCLLRSILSCWNFFTLIFSIRFTFDPLVFLFNLKFVEWLVGAPVKWKGWWIFIRWQGWLIIGAVCIDLTMFLALKRGNKFLKLYKNSKFLINRIFYLLHLPSPLCSTFPHKASPTKCQEEKSISLYPA